MTAPVVQLHGLRFAYDRHEVLKLDTFALQPGEHCAVLGASGCGKSTLLHLIAGLLRPAQGSVRICDRRLDEMTPSALDRFRGRHLGIVFQRLHLLPALSVLDNLLLAQRLARVPTDPQAARALLGALGVGELARVRPDRLSVGQAQRVAIARAIVHRPALLLADEPTSSLDDANAERAIDLLREQAGAIGAALLVVTHDRRVRGALGRELHLARPA